MCFVMKLFNRTSEAKLKLLLLLEISRHSQPPEIISEPSISISPRQVMKGVKHFTEKTEQLRHGPNPMDLPQEVVPHRRCQYCDNPSLIRKSDDPLKMSWNMRWYFFGRKLSQKCFWSRLIDLVFIKDGEKMYQILPNHQSIWQDGSWDCARGAPIKSFSCCSEGLQRNTYVGHLDCTILFVPVRIGISYGNR